MREENNTEKEIDLRELFLVLWRGKYFIIICTIISLVAGSIYLRRSSPHYEVSMLLAPVQGEESSPNLGNLGNLASLAGISLPSGNASDFAKYKIMLKSQEIADLVFEEENLVQELFSGEWDDKRQIFREPELTRKNLIKNYIRTLITGRPTKKYVAPNQAKIAKFIRSNIRISQDPFTQYLKLSAKTPKPKLLTQLMVSINDETDKLFKEKYIKQADDAVKFYQIKISKARSQEHRQILATLIAKEERKLLLASRDGPFVAEILTGPNTSLNPISPKTKNVLMLSILLGGFLSFALLFIRSFLSKNRHE